MIRSSYLTLLLLFLFSLSALAQSRSRRKKSRDESRFSASVLAGAYLSQLDGDLYVGFDKPSLSVGVRGTAELAPHWDFDFELNYQQKGSRFEERLNGPKDRLIHLDYMEVPFFLRHYPGRRDRGLSLAIGLAYARRIGSRIEDTAETNLIAYNEIVSDFRSNELSIIPDISYRINPHLSFGVRYSYALTRFYDNPEGYRPESTGFFVEEITLLRNYLFGIYGAYTL
ncbi:MAG: outer membrane beta-barrel protein [Bacteroidota bacterium]